MPKPPSERFNDLAQRMGLRDRAVPLTECGGDMMAMMEAIVSRLEALEVKLAGLRAELTGGR